MTDFQAIAAALNEQLLLPGRLGDPHRDWRTDPRVDPLMLAALAQCGLDDPATPPLVNVDSPLEQRREFSQESSVSMSSGGKL